MPVKRKSNRARNPYAMKPEDSLAPTKNAPSKGLRIKAIIEAQTRAEEKKLMKQKLSKKKNRPKLK